MFKLEIPKKYIKIFEMNELEEITIEVDGNHFTFNRGEINLLPKECIYRSSFYPLSWYKEIPKPQEDYIKKIINHHHNVGSLSLIIKTNNGDIKVFHNMFFGKIIEVDSSMATAVCNLESRLQHIHNNWGIVNYQLIDLYTHDDNTFTELNRYFVYSKNWLNDAGSSGGGNITGLLTREDLEKRVGSLQTYEKVGPVNYRLTQQFIERMEKQL